MSRFAGLDNRQHPRMTELTIFRDGRVYCTEQEKFLSVAFVHGTSFKGPIVFWGTNGKTCTMPLARLLYETYIVEKSIGTGSTIVFKDGDEMNIKLENLSKVKRWEKETKVSRETDVDCWQNGNDAVYC